MKFCFLAVAAAVAATTSSTSVDARSTFGIRTHNNAFAATRTSFGRLASVDVTDVSSSVVASFPRGGASDSDDADAEEEAGEVKLYLPGLLEATVSGKWVSCEQVVSYAMHGLRKLCLRGCIIHSNFFTRLV